MPASHKLKLTLLDTEISTSRVDRWLWSKFNRRSDRDLIRHSLMWLAYPTIYGDEAIQQYNNQCLVSSSIGQTKRVWNETHSIQVVSFQRMTWNETIEHSQYIGTLLLFTQQVRNLTQSCASINSYTGADELHKSATHIKGQADTRRAWQYEAELTTYTLKTSSHCVHFGCYVNSKQQTVFPILGVYYLPVAMVSLLHAE